MEVKRFLGELCGSHGMSIVCELCGSLYLSKQSLCKVLVIYKSMHSYSAWLKVLSPPTRSGLALRDSV